MTDFFVQPLFSSSVEKSSKESSYDDFSTGDFQSAAVNLYKIYKLLTGTQKIQEELRDIVRNYRIVKYTLPRSRVKTVILPSFWSDRAGYIAADKYLTEIPVYSLNRYVWEISQNKYKENNIFELVYRVTAKICYQFFIQLKALSKKYSTDFSKIDDSIFSPDEKEEFLKFVEGGIENLYKDLFYRLYYYLITQRVAFNSPVWFNVGYEYYPIRDYLIHQNNLKDSLITVTYKDTIISQFFEPNDSVISNLISNCPSSFWLYSPVHSLENRVYKAVRYDPRENIIDGKTNCVFAPQISACYIIRVEDTIESIFSAVDTSAKIFRLGSGVGMDWSRLRPENSLLSNGGMSSGPLSFMEVVDRTGGVMRSGGRTRRSAIMFTLSIDHPDIEKFIKIKSREEEKARALVQTGYSSGLDGEAYKTVAFQNVNISVRIPDSFMHNYLNGGEKETKLLHLLAENIHKCGDPGIQFTDQINKWRTCTEDTINSSNPCSEYLWFDNTSCNLASINLYKSIPEMFNENIQVEQSITDFEKLISSMIIAMDCLISLGGFPSKDIAIGTTKYRTLGLGYANLARLFTHYGWGYDSLEAKQAAALITILMTLSAYETSYYLYGIFGGYIPSNPQTIRFSEIINRHLLEFEDLFNSNGDEDKGITGILLNQNAVQIQSKILSKFNELLNIKNLMMRNYQVTCLAPTGTIALLMDCETTGIEPYLSLSYTKYLVGGGTLTLVAEGIKDVFKKFCPFLKDTEIEEIMDCIVQNDKQKLFLTMDTDKYLPVDKKEDILSKIKSAVKTSWPNILNEEALTGMDHVEMMAWIQPFVSMGISKTVNLPEHSTVEDIMQTIVESWKKGLKCLAIYRDNSKVFQPLQQIKKEEKQTTMPTEKELNMPKVRPGTIRKFKVGNVSGYLIVGIHPETQKPGDVFINIAREGSTLGGMITAFGILLSLALQYGIPLSVIYRKLSYLRFEPYGFTDDEEIPAATSIVDYIVKRLAKDFSIEEEDTTVHNINIEPNKLPTKIGDVCSNCGELLSMIGGCRVCLKCGTQSGCG